MMVGVDGSRILLAGGVANKLLVGQKKDTLKVPEAAKKFYQGNGALAKMTGGYIDMPHKTLGKGGTYCWKQGNKKVSEKFHVAISAENRCRLKGNNKQSVYHTIDSDFWNSLLGIDLAVTRCASMYLVSKMT